MARKKYGFSETRIQKFKKEGRGQGTGNTYTPWLTVSDVPSLGRVHRVFCEKTGRVHHFLSDTEYYAFLLLVWDDNVIDIREQYPLCRKKTLEIAARCGVKHPIDPRSGALWVVTTDFLVTVESFNNTAEIAYAVKTSSSLTDERTLEKLEIERRYWETEGVTWRLITECEVKTIFTKNLAWILNANTTHANTPKTKDLDRVVELALWEEKKNNPYAPAKIACRNVDLKVGYIAGTALGVFRRLLGRKRLLVDLNIQQLQDLPLKEYVFGEGEYE